MASVHVLALGDSITNGGAANGVVTPYMVKLRNETGKDGQWQGHNFGMPSRGTQYMLRRCGTDIHRGLYDWVIVLGGANDLGLGLSGVEIYDNLVAIAKHVRAKNMKCAVGPILPQKDTATWTAAKQVTIDTVNTLLRNDTKHFDAFFDLYQPTAMEDDVAADELEADYDSGDKLHPNQAGHDEMSGDFAIVLKEHDSQHGLHDVLSSDVHVAARFRQHCSKATTFSHANIPKPDDGTETDLKGIISVPNNETFTQGTLWPSYLTENAAFNNVPVISFDGAENGLVCDAMIATIDRTVAFSLYLVVQAGTGAQSLLGNRAASVGWELRYVAGTMTFQMTTTISSNSLIVNYPTDLHSRPRLVEIHSDGAINGAGGESHLTCLVDGRTVTGTATTDTLTGAISDNSPAIGSRTDLSNPMTGQIGDFVLARNWGLAQKTLLREELAALYDIGLPQDARAATMLFWRTV